MIEMDIGLPGQILQGNMTNINGVTTTTTLDKNISKLSIDYRVGN